METKVLLRLIKDDIKLLDEINGSFLSSETLTADEVEVALARARGLVMEFEMLSKNITQTHGIEFKPEVKLKSRVEEKVEVKPKEAEFLNGVSESIDLEESKVSIPLINKLISKIKEEVAPFVDKTAAKEKVAVEAKTEVSVEKMIKEVLKNEEAPVDKIGISGDKNQSVNDLLAQDRIENGFEGMPLKNIRDGIGLNDRFLFIRELFAEDSEKYEKTIASLDNFIAIGEAVEYLKQNFKWNKTEASQKFLALVKRRFSK
jgi:hypothetical protein